MNITIYGWSTSAVVLKWPSLQAPRRERLVVRGWIELPTFRFSGLRIIVQDWPRWSLGLLSEPW
jgi:hypothetical protein